MKLKRSEAQSSARQFRLRGYWVVGALLLGASGIVGRAVYMQVLSPQFFVDQGDERFMRNVKIPAHRGAILDRAGEPIAVSTPVDTVWVVPKELATAADQFSVLAKALQRDEEWLARQVTSHLDTPYLVLARQLQPDEADRIKALHLPGVYLQREYRRFYPAGEVTGHVLGGTGNDDQGQEGMELAFEQKLLGEPGLKRVIQDRMRRTVENVESVRPARPGEDLITSIDLRIQYLAYRELKAAVRDFQARAGSAVVIDVRTGEILAMVDQPAFNPNDRAQFDVQRYRNRVETDILEPGSSVKPFFVIAALASGKFNASSVIDTSPGFIRVGNRVFEDEHNWGQMDFATILAKSSNVGMAHIALALDRSAIWNTLSSLGFGQVSATGFPGESAGVLTNYTHWGDVQVATMAHGYGMSVTPLQLAQAYAVVGALGVRRPLTLRRVDGVVPAGDRVLDAQVCRDAIHMLESVVLNGTGTKAAVRGYRVAGKTGTAWKAIPGGYSTNKYMAVFGGVVPASAPRFAMVVVIDDPSNGKYYGGDVAAPVFSAVMAGALRLLAVPPDDLSRIPSASFVQSEVPR
ncbi:MAG: penicillin-binding transpeptidase domain-containing protein [Proteobacteria bacterium]|nr:penicillin-binding transpeptidase domain-containing protein [Pseudomonadota bacterium]